MLSKKLSSNKKKKKNETHIHILDISVSQSKRISMMSEEVTQPHSCEGEVVVTGPLWIHSLVQVHAHQLPLLHRAVKNALHRAVGACEGAVAAHSILSVLKISTAGALLMHTTNTCPYG